MSPPNYTRQKYCKSLILFIALAIAVIGWWQAKAPQSVKAAGEAPAGYSTFEGPQTHPLALTPDGTRLLAVNTPNGTLSVFYLIGDVPTLAAEIPVGLEPVTVAVRNNREVWVANWLSDS